MSAAGDGDRGATLLEMLVVLAIVGMVTALVFPVAHRSQRVSTLASEAAALQGAVRAARADARSTGARVDVVVAADGRAWRSGDQWRRLPEAILAAPAGAAALSFWPDGGAAGDGVELSAGEHRRRVTADGVTGAAGPVGR